MKKKDAYRHFVKVAQQEGSIAAMLYAAEALPEAFCKSHSELRQAAEFVQLHGRHALLDTLPATQQEAAPAPAVAGLAAPHPADAPAKAPAPQAAATASEGAPKAEAPGDAHVLVEVCGKCVKRLQKKGNSFNPGEAMVAAVGRDNGIAATVECVSCMKECKSGPCVQYTVLRDGQELASQMITGVADAAAVAGVLSTAKAAVARTVPALSPAAVGVPAPATVVPASTPVLAGTAGQPTSGAHASPVLEPAAVDTGSRAGVRAKLAQRMASIVEGIEL